MKPAGGIALAALGLVISFTARAQRSVGRDLRYGGIYEYIRTKIPMNEPIGVLLCSRSILAYGENIDRRPLYLGASFPYTADASQWAVVLRKNGIKVVAVGPILEEWRQEAQRKLRWLEDPNGPFLQALGRDPFKETVLFKLKKKELSSSR
jgi:hypothetical protein